MVGYRGAAEGFKPLPCLGQKSTKIYTAVTKSGTGTWGLGRGTRVWDVGRVGWDSGTWDVRTWGCGDVGTWDSGMWRL